MRSNERILIDTHIWLWFVDADPCLINSVRNKIDRAITEDSLYLSAISVWEIAMLQSKNKIKLGQPTIHWVKKALQESSINLIQISPEIAVESCELPWHFHGDPADRLLAATARIEDLILITKDQKLIEYSEKKFIKVFPA